MGKALRSIVDIPPPFNKIVLIVLIVTAGSAFTAAVSHVRKYFSHRQEIEFKRELLDRGMSAEEIEHAYQTGSYTLAFWMAIACTAISAVAIWLAAPRQVRAVAGRVRRLT